MIIRTQLGAPPPTNLPPLPLRAVRIPLTIAAHNRQWDVKYSSSPHVSKTKLTLADFASANPRKSRVDDGALGSTGVAEGAICQGRTFKTWLHCHADVRESEMWFNFIFHARMGRTRGVWRY